MSIIRDIKMGFKINGPLTIFRLFLYPFVFAVLVICAVAIGICAGLFNASFSDGIETFKDVMNLDV